MQSSQASQRLMNLTNNIVKRVGQLSGALNDPYNPRYGSSAASRDVLVHHPILWVILEASLCLDTEVLAILREALHSSADAVATPNLRTTLKVETLTAEETVAIDVLMCLLIARLGFVKRDGGALDTSQHDHLAQLKSSVAKTEVAQGGQVSLLHSPLCRMLISVVDENFAAPTILEWPSLALFNVLRLKNRSKPMVQRYLQAFISDNVTIDSMPEAFQMEPLTADILEGWVWLSLLREMNKRSGAASVETVFSTLRSLVNLCMSEGLPSLEGRTALRPMKYLEFMTMLGDPMYSIKLLMEKVPELRRLLFILARFLDGLKASGQLINDRTTDSGSYNSFVHNYSKEFKFEMRLLLVAAQNRPVEERIADMTDVICSRMQKMFEAKEVRSQSVGMSSAEHIAGGLSEIKEIISDIELEFEPLSMLLGGANQLRQHMELLYKYWAERLSKDGRIVAALYCYTESTNLAMSAHTLIECLASPLLFQPRNPMVVDEVILRAREFLWSVCADLQDFSKDLDYAVVNTLEQLAKAAKMFEDFYKLSEEDTINRMETLGLVSEEEETLHEWNLLGNNLGLRLLDLYSQALYGSHRKGCWTTPSQIEMLKRKATLILSLCHKVRMSEDHTPMVKELLNSIMGKVTSVNIMGT